METFDASLVFRGVRLERMVVEAKDADGAFLAEQYRLHADLVFRRCLVMSGGDAEWARDVTQDAFLRLLERRGRVEGASVAGWLLTVATRLCIDRWRRERGVWSRVRKALGAMVQGGVPESEAAPDGWVEPSEEVSRQLQAALARLPPKQRAAVAMKYGEGFRQTEIAATMGCSTGYVSKLLARALDSLRGQGWEMDRG